MKDNKSVETSEKGRLSEPHVRVIIMIAIFIIAIIALSVYNIYNIRSATDIESIDSLSGQRIACCVGWEADYILSPRNDITLLRYDTNADCILGLSYGQVDAVALDDVTLQTVLTKTSGLEILPEPIAKIGCTLYASYGAEEILAEFNEFADNFVKSDEYEAFHDNILSENYVMPDIPEVEDGKVLHVGYVPECYPEAYVDFNTGEPAGYGIEIIERFAYEYGYTIEWEQTSDTSALVQLARNQLDFAACYVSDVYREDTENSGRVHMTNAFVYSNVFLVKIKDGEKLKITGEITY